MNENGQHKVMVVTGTRAEFGLLRPVMHAIHAHPALELYVVAAGSHMVQPAVTFREVKAELGTVSDEQQLWLDVLPNAKVWRPSDWPAIQIELAYT